MGIPWGMVGNVWFHCDDWFCCNFLGGLSCCRSAGFLYEAGLGASYQKISGTKNHAVDAVGVCCAISGAPLRVLFFMLPTAPLLALFISFTFASSKLKNFLIRHLAEQMEPTSWSAHTIFQAVSVLSHFSNHFRFWLLAALFSFLGVYPSVRI